MNKLTRVYQLSGALCLMFIISSFAACTLLSVPTPQDFEEKVAGAYTTVTTVREAGASLLSASRISASDAQNIQNQANTLREAIDVARTLHDGPEGQPQLAEDKLTVTIEALKLLQRYVEGRK